MARFSDRIASFVRSPKGQEYLNKAKAQASKPENRAKVQQLADRVMKRGKGTGGGSPR